MNNNEEKIVQSYRSQIATWFNRAAMAYQMHRYELSELALKRRWELQGLLAELEGTSACEALLSPKEVFSNLHRDEPPTDSDLDSSCVPLRPSPITGSGSIALPLPHSPED